MQGNSVENSDTRNTLSKIVGNPYSALISLLMLAAIVAGSRMWVGDSPSSFETFFLDAIQAVVIGVSVSVVFGFLHSGIHAQEIEARDQALEEKIGQYSDVFAMADVFHSAKKNSGLAGVEINLKEDEIFKSLEASIPEVGSVESAPTIWWMNFRIANYDKHATTIESFVRKGGRVKLITNHPYNPNIEHRLSEAYSDKSIDDYRAHFILQGKCFTQLQEKLVNDTDVRGTFTVVFNRGTVGAPLLIEELDPHMKAYTGFYLNETAGKLPYVVWETSPAGMVRKLKEYANFKMENSISCEEFSAEFSGDKEDS